MSSRLSDYNYALPEELIALEPAPKRDQSRLLVLNKVTETMKDRRFLDIVNQLHKGDLLVLNNTKVFPARLFGYKQSGAKVEILLCKKNADGSWQILGRNIKALDRLEFADSSLEAEVKSKSGREACLVFNMKDALFWREIERIGKMPLPPYISKKNFNNDSFHRERYQTVFASHVGSVAAPTAGLHFSEELLKELLNKGVEVDYLTLHVGLGTFLPVESPDVSDHKMHSEYYSVPQKLIKKIIETKNNHKRVVAVGTTTCRALETVFCESHLATLISKYETENLSTVNEKSELSTNNYDISDAFGETDIFIYPPYEFKCVDALITNFHLPKSTLLMLVSALAGRAFIMKAYKHAVKHKYRFYSYGDAMFIQ